MSALSFSKKVLHQRKQKKCRNNQKKSVSDKIHVENCDKKKQKQTNDQNKEADKNRTKRKCE